MASVAAISSEFATDQARWAAVVDRNPGADDQFFYSVRTTGVYCRPSCGARLALRENVAFHECCSDAERAGFRPCKRCRPNEPPLEQRQAEAIAMVCREIDQSTDTLSFDRLAKLVGMSRFHFQRVFRQVTGMTPKAYASARRTDRVREELTEGSASITDAIYASGFESAGRFYAEAPKTLGMTASALRKGADGIAVRFAVAQCSLGSILVAATERGICAISLGDDPAILVRELQDRFPKAIFTSGDVEFDQQVAQVIGLVEQPRIGLQLPLDLQGTAFCQRVWRALSEIPAGSTATYSEIANKLGAPRSSRAVARACAANTIAVAIPCHRVIRTDGSISGYRWGVERKRALLESERAQTLLDQRQEPC